MNKKKRILVAVIVIIVIVAIIAGAIGVYLWHQKNNLVADVQTVGDLNGYYGEEGMTSYGMLTNDFYQDVFLLDEQVVAEVYVEEGQEVKAGDPLLAYDMTLSELNLEMKELEVENIKNRLILANRELEKLRNTTPIPEYVPAPDPEPDPEPDPVVPETPQRDPETFAYNYISGDTDTKNAKHSGKGTPEDPYVILCMPGCYVEGGYFNALGASEEVICVRLQLINPETCKEIKEKFWDLTSRQFGDITFEDTARWSVETRQPVAEEPEDILEEPEIPEEPEDVDAPEEPEGYTATELAAAIKAAEKEIKDTDLERRKAELELEQMKKVSAEGIVTATIDGVVKAAGDKENPPKDGSAFITVSGSEGLYVTGSLSEMQLGEVQVGQIVYANSWESGKNFEATIQEISPYPTENSNSWGNGNPNVSYYPYTAYIADSEGLKNGEYVDLTMTPARNSEESENTIYLQRAYVREENGRKYVFMADENDRLKKQYVETGKILYGEVIEIKSGLTREDRIAFPYGKAAKEGVKVKDGDGSDSGIMYY